VENDTMTESKVRKGFYSPCPRCGEEAVYVDLFNVGSVRCGECNEERTLKQLRRLVDGWSAVLAWLDTAPLYPEEK
jgi:uncharacterized protein (DUF983 family)